MNFEIKNPTTTKELLRTIKQFQNKKFRFAAGCTDLLPGLRKNPVKNLTVINISQVVDKNFSMIRHTPKGLWLGARVTANDILNNEEIKISYPVLHEAALSLASVQIRQVATIGGNLCTASPSGDISCSLMALDAKCELLNTNGKKRIAPVRNFFTGVRKTVLNKNELLYGIIIPIRYKGTKKYFSRFIKIGTRKSMECSVVSLAYHIQADGNGEVIRSGIAIGSSAPTIRFAETACDFLAGKNIPGISEEEKEVFAGKILSYASPVSDIRATAWYRKKVLFNISKSIFENVHL